MTARLSDETLAALLAARQAQGRAQAALSVAQRLEALATERYNALVVSAGFDPARVSIGPDGTVTDNGVPVR